MTDQPWTDRVAGTLLGLAAGDALGAGYESTRPRPDVEIGMVGGGQFGWEPGEWTDDTLMAICVAEVTATGQVNLDAIGRRFLNWYAAGPKDVGAQRARVLAGARGRADRVTAVAARHCADNPRGGAGSGSLMRTAPVALAHLGDDEAIVETAKAVSALTHGDPLAGEACALWCVAIDRAVREERLDGIDDALFYLPGERRRFWSQRLRAARARPPGSFMPNGFVVTALQAAVAAVEQTPVPAESWRHLPAALEAAVRIGDDTDTVAAIAGGLLGARWGGSALPFAWRRILHGWPGYRARDLVRLAVLTARKGQTDSSGWPAAADLTSHSEDSASAAPLTVPLPDDAGVVIGNVAGMPDHGIDAVVSLCRVGREHVPAGVEHHEVHLIDVPGANRHVPHVVLDTAAGILALRSEGKRVFLHCAAGQSRTPAVAAAYLHLRLGISGQEALRRVGDAVEHYQHNRELVTFVRSLPEPPGIAADDDEHCTDQLCGSAQPPRRGVGQRRNDHAEGQRAEHHAAEDARLRDPRRGGRGS